MSFAPPPPTEPSAAEITRPPRRIWTYIVGAAFIAAVSSAWYCHHLWTALIPDSMSAKSSAMGEMIVLFLMKLSVIGCSVIGALLGWLIGWIVRKRYFLADRETLDSILTCWSAEPFMKTTSFITLLAFMTIGTKVFADSPTAPVSWVTTSARGDFLFKMVPAKWRKQGENYVVDREAFGVAYAINEEGEFNEVWRTKGWYTFEGYLSEEGRYFVRMGPWASDQANHTDLAIAFYDRGKLLKQYQVRKLIKKTDLIENSVSHYNWRPQIQTEPNGFKGGTFHLVMIDKTAHSFDVSTGKLLTTEIDAGAKSSQEIRQEERQAAVKKGQALYEASSFKKDYQDHFHVEHLEADNGKIYGVWFKEPEWRADLTPKKKYTQQCEVRAVFPIAGPEEVDASISSAEIDTALQAALSHPFVSKRFKIGGATGLRLRITGDRLHWDTEELREHLAKLKKSEAKAENLRHWAELIIDAQKRQYISMFLNTETKELIYEDQSKWPWEPVLLDADNAGPDKINVDSPLDGIEVK